MLVSSRSREQRIADSRQQTADSTQHADDSTVYSTHFNVQIAGGIIILQRKAKVFLPAFRDRHRYYLLYNSGSLPHTTLIAVNQAVVATVPTQYCRLLQQIRMVKCHSSHLASKVMNDIGSENGNREDN